MGVLDRIKLNAYPELKKLNISNDLLKSILSNKNFKKNYKTKIKGFLKNLSESPKDSKK